MTAPATNSPDAFIPKLRHLPAWRLALIVLAVGMLFAAPIVLGVLVLSHDREVSAESHQTAADNAQLQEDVSDLARQVQTLGGTPVAGPVPPSAATNGQNGRNGESVVGPAGPPGVGVNGSNGLNGANGGNGLNGESIEGPAGQDGADSTVPGPPGATGATGPMGSTGSPPSSFSFDYQVLAVTYRVTCTLQTSGAYDCPVVALPAA